MPIDIRRNFVFIHIPKTGGTSIERMFHLVGREHLFSYLPLPYFVPANKSPQHLTWLELKKNIEVALQMHSTPSPGFDQTCKEFLENAYKFAFVRNPWDRFLSEYYWRKAWYFKELQKGINFFYSPNVMESLDTFVSVFDLPEEKRMDKKRGGDGHWETQLSFLVNESGKIAVNFVGRFENFEHDLRMVASKIGIRLGQILHVAKSQRDKDYRPYYSAYARSAVQSFYKDDIREFGYTF
jgi:hypothetical protein